MRLGSAIPLAVAALTLACGDDSGPNVNFDLDDDTLFAGAEATLVEGDVFAALTRKGSVKLGLTSDRVYFELSDAVRDHVDSEIGRELDESDSRLARSIGSAVRRGVAKAMQFNIDFPVDDIRDVDYRRGELVFDFEPNARVRSLDNMDVDGEPITRAFEEDDARAFVAAFRRVKQGDAAAPGGRTDPSVPDTAGGASF